MTRDWRVLFSFFHVQGRPPTAAVTHVSSFVVQVSEKDTVSQSAESPATDVAVSSSHNGPLTSGTSKTPAYFWFLWFRS